MQEFVTQQNIKRFEKMLQRESDASRREVLKQLLETERAKLHDLAKQTIQDA